eukprot:scaffold29107_cov61-Phaeocystis_antarctica.AAC.1
MGQGRKGSLREVKSACGWRCLRRCSLHRQSSEVSSSDLALRAKASAAMTDGSCRAVFPHDLGITIGAYGPQHGTLEGGTAAGAAR